MIAPRNAAAIASLALLCGAAACTNFYEIPIETPIQPKMDVSPFSRVLIAGFIGGGTEDVDPNLETVRLLRSQLRSKSSLRVIEAEVLPLAEMARESKPAAMEPVPALAAEGTQPPAGATPAGGTTPAAAGAGDAIRTERDLERYQGIFADVAFWRKIGEEYQNPLIVTGTVMFTPHQTAGFVVRNVEQYDALGRRIVQPVRTYMERKGFILEPRFIFIDGRTGAQLYSERMREEILYSSQQNTPALSSYFELMDRMIPSFLSTLSMQRVRGTRVLLK